MQDTIPYISIVIPVYNRAELLRRCLTSLLMQTYPPNRFEIIIVDDGSTEDVAGAARAAIGAWAGGFSVLRKANGGPASARNAGIRAAKGEIIAFTDSDCEADPNWLSALVEVIQNESASGSRRPNREYFAAGLDCQISDLCQLLPASGTARKGRLLDYRQRCLSPVGTA